VVRLVTNSTVVASSAENAISHSPELPLYSIISFACATKVPQETVSSASFPMSSTIRYLAPGQGPGKPALGPVSWGLIIASIGSSVFCGKVSGSMLD